MFLNLGGHQPGSFAAVNSGVRFPQTIQHDIDTLDLIGKLAQPGGKIKIVQAVGTSKGLMTASKLVTQLKLAGEFSMQFDAGAVEATKIWVCSLL